MASLPARPASQRRSSPEQQLSSSSSSSESQHEGARSQSRARSISSEDSQTVMLNTSSLLADQTKTDSATNATTTPPQDDQDVKKCWICFSDETEDTAESSEWRSPCPCALVAHEDCLLDWIADMESPSSRKRTLAPPHITCPQCKADIHLARPRNYLVELVKALERVAARLVTPSAILIAVSTVFHASSAHGIHSVYTVFGPDDGYRILRPYVEGIVHPREIAHLSDIRQIFEDSLSHWRLHVGLPLITPLLVLLRTRLADSVLPVLPILFFATQGHSDEPLDFASWPPSASLTLALLPYFRGAYNGYYERFWAEKEKKWLKDVQPRSRDQVEDGAEGGLQELAADDEADLGENNFEIRIDANIWEDWGGDGDGDDDDGNAAQERERIRQDIMQHGPVPGQAPPLHAPPLQDDAPAAVPNDPANQQQAPPQDPLGAQAGQQQPRPQRNGGNAGGNQERHLSFTPNALAEKVLGALLFPTIASLSGEALRLLLPRAWTTSSRLSTGALTKGRSATGLLQEKWGRSIVGGCLFVVVKDAVMLYVRWKMAQQHRRRRVLDYDRKTKRAR